MRNGKFVLLLLAIMAIGVLVLPSTVTLFAGQHTWYDKGALPCEKCHADVADEFQSSANHHPGDCVMCHQVEPLYPGDVSAAEGKHAATVVPCDYCHYPEANAFDNDPHYPFVKAADEDDQLPNATEACVACHTHANVEINFTWKKAMTFGFTANATADRQKQTTEDLWDPTQDFGANGTETHYIWEYQAFNNSNHTQPYWP